MIAIAMAPEKGGDFRDEAGVGFPVKHELSSP